MNYLKMILNNQEIENIRETFEEKVLLNLKEDNIKEIITFLQENKVKVIADILTNYLDLFLLEPEEFKKRFNKLKIQYGDNLSEFLNYKLAILEGMVE